MNNTISKINYLDCIFRDGRYYNNWNFNRKLINNGKPESLQKNLDGFIKND